MNIFTESRERNDTENDIAKAANSLHGVVSAYRLRDWQSLPIVSFEPEQYVHNILKLDSSPFSLFPLYEFIKIVDYEEVHDF